MEDKKIEELEKKAYGQLKPQKPKMKISGKSNFLLAKLSGQKKTNK